MSSSAEALNGEAMLAKEFKDYAYGVSHDVGAPVRAMVEFSRLLTTEHAQSLNAEGKLFLSLIIENGEKLQNMMAGLLEYSRLNTEAQSFVPVNCNNILKDCTNLLSEKIAYSAAQIKADFLPEIMGDSRQIRQLFTALLDNALKFQPQGQMPEISISAIDEGAFLKFVIQDNGIDIDEHHQKKIFQIFQRLHSNEIYPGIGIGLTLAQKIVRRHRGEIWINSTPGNGAKVTFTIAA